MPTNKRGIELLLDPSLNKSTDFTDAEKQTLGIVCIVQNVNKNKEIH
jgi:malate dehydrogenase (oxaloacetate-decarboxylating)(NADP+)